MILKHILGKSIEAAKKTAQQMYGDDFLIIESTEGQGNKQAKITIFSDKEPKMVEEKEKPASSKKPGKQKKNQPAGVHFERSNGNGKSIKNGNSGERLNSLRKIAEQLEKKDHNATDAPGSEKDGDSISQMKNLYSRAAIRSKDQSAMHAHQKDESTKSEFISKQDANIQDHQQILAEKKDYSPIELPPRNDQREITALHKRFDKLEALLDSAFISANLDYASHPVFQQLVSTGINSSIIAGWFSRIVSSGIDPFDQPEQFMIKLAAIIRNALGKADEDEAKKFLLFVGPSGAGKTTLIMKLSTHPEFMVEKKIAVLSVYPQNKDHLPYYTVLQPFCENYKIPYFVAKNIQDINTLMEDLNDFDHVLIDTPSINLEKESSFRDFWTIRQMLAPFAPLEIHYVINASMNRFYFRDSSATHHPLKPDFVAITHLDEISQWGPIIPFLEKMGCNTRYISKGLDLPNSLSRFNPQWFAQKILQENS